MRSSCQFFFQELEAKKKKWITSNLFDWSLFILLLLFFVPFWWRTDDGVDSCWRPSGLKLPVRFDMTARARRRHVAEVRRSLGYLGISQIPQMVTFGRGAKVASYQSFERVLGQCTLKVFRTRTNIVVAMRQYKTRFEFSACAMATTIFVCFQTPQRATTKKKQKKTRNVRKIVN